MCSVSFVMDSKAFDWQQRYWPLVPFQPVTPPTTTTPLPTQLEVEEFRRLLDRARKYDKDNGEPDCELEEKKQTLKKMAEALGVDIAFV